ncbi:MAG: ThiF family adenylyltransferase [Nanoarchaeota archaeon]
MAEIDYSKQNAIFDRAVLRNSSIAISGASNMADFMLIYLAGLGIGNVMLFNNGEGGFLKKDYSIIKKINSDVNLEIINSPFEQCLMAKSGAIIDFSNSAEQKKQILNYAAKTNTRLFLSASSSQIESIYNPSMLDSVMWKPAISSSSLYFSSAIIAAIALDESRKALLLISGDDCKRKKLCFSPLNKERFIERQTLLDKITEHQMPKTPRALVIGAGGIGTYVALNLALSGIPIEIWDGDNIENTNLNRQVLYYESIGKNKAVTLKQRLESITNADIIANPYFFEKKHAKSGYSAIFSCVDSWPARKMLNKYALDNNIPLIDAGVGAFTARLDVFNKNTCLECRRGIVAETPPAGGCTSLQESNVVMCNAFIGAMAVSEFYAMQFSKENAGKQLLYFSKKALDEKVSLPGIERQCSCEEKGCKCHKGVV